MTGKSLRMRLSALLVGMIVLAMAPAAGAAPDGKTFTANLSPTTVTAGTVVPFQVTVTNTSTSAPLGAIEITPPEGFSIDGVSLSRTDWSVVSSDPLRVAANRSQTRLQPSQSLTVTITSTVLPLQAGGTPYDFGVEARQANNFKGTFNDLNLVLAPGHTLTTVVTGQVVDCHGKTQCQSTPRTVGNTTVQVSVLCAVTDCGRLAVDVDDNCLGACPLSRAVFWNPPAGAAQGPDTVEVLVTIDKSAFSGNPNTLQFFIAASDSQEAELCGTNVQITCSYSASRVSGGHTQVIARVEPIDPRGFVS